MNNMYKNVLYVVQFNLSPGRMTVRQKKKLDATAMWCYMVLNSRSFLRLWLHFASSKQDLQGEASRAFMLQQLEGAQEKKVDEKYN